MAFFSHLVSVMAGFGLGIYVHKNCHFEKFEVNHLEHVTGPFYLPTRWKTTEELKEKN